MYWTQAKMLLLADVDKYSFTNADGPSLSTYLTLFNNWSSSSATLSFLMLCTDAGSLLGDTGATVAVGGAVCWRFRPWLLDTDVDTLEVERLTALYVVMVGEFDMAPSWRGNKIRQHKYFD